MGFYVYKIKDTPYIGSTKNIKNRFLQHKSNAYNSNDPKYNQLVYKYIREKKIIPQLEILFCYKGECSSKIQRLVEQFYINKYDTFKNGLNQRWALFNKKGRIERSKQYYLNNIDKIKEKHKIYRENNKEKIKKYCTDYYNKNCERIKVERRITNKKPKKCLICNRWVRSDSYARHKRSKYCLKIKEDKANILS
jgi:hypothetical protein